MSDLMLRSYHEVSGALFRAEGGWDVPSSYGALDREAAAVRRDVGTVDFSDRAKIAVRGEDRVTFVDGLVTADVKVLGAGKSAYALVLSEFSRVLGDLRITAFDDRLVVDIEAAQKDTLLEYFRKAVVSDDVTLEDLGPCGHLEVHGPNAPEFVSLALDTDVRGLSPDEQVSFPVDRHRIGYASRLRTLGETAYAIWSVDTSLESVWAGLGALGVPPFGRDAYEVLRIEAGVPRYGPDMSEETLALEVAPEGAVSFTKGCYRGQEVVARGTYVGHVNRKLLGLKIDGDVPPSRGNAVRCEGDVVGAVTSACWSPTTGRVIALALLRPDKIAEGGRLFIDRDGWDLRAQLHPLPFVYGSG